MIEISRLISEFDVLPEDAQERLRALPLSGSRILVTGASGYVGTWILGAIAWLNSSRAEQISVDALSRRPTGSSDAWLKWYACDVRDFAPRSHYDFVLHAALPSSAVSAAGLPELQSIAVEGTRQILRAVTAGKPRVLMLSSGAVYGLDHDRPVDERDFAPIDPLDEDEFYAITKIASEALCGAQASACGLDHSIARLFTCMGIGYRNHTHMAHVSLMNAALKGEAVVVRGTGTPVRSYIYGADLAIWLLTVLAEGASREAYNIGSPNHETIRGLAQRIAHRAPGGPCEVQVQNKPECDGRRTYYVPRVDKAQSAFGLKIWTPLDIAIEQTLRLSLSN